MAERIIKSPSPKQLELLRHLYRFQRRHGYAPTLEELGQSMGITKVTVYQYVRTLERKGLINRLRNRARSLQISDEGKLLHLFADSSTAWKLVGQYHTSGKLQFYHSPRKVEPDLLIQRYRNASLLRVTGSAPASDRTIREGDYLLIEPLRDRHNHQLALIQTYVDKVELYKFHRKQGKLFIQKEELVSTLTPIRHADILGVVVGLIRTY